jgi:hypothetical protein
MMFGSSYFGLRYFGRLYFGGAATGADHRTLYAQSAARR